MFKIETISSEAILSEDLRKNVQRSRLCQPVGPSGVAQRYQHIAAEMGNISNLVNRATDEDMISTCGETRSSS